MSVPKSLQPAFDDINDWKNIPEQYWNMALEEMKVPK